MTRKKLNEYRRIRWRYLRYGRRTFRTDAEYKSYIALRDEVTAWIASLPRDEQNVCYYYYHQVYAWDAVGWRIGYSERHARRIARRLLAGMHDALRRY